MPTRRIFVIWTNPLCLEALRRLLVEPSVEWVGTSSDHRAAHGLILSLRPDTVLIEQPEGGSVSGDVLEILETAAPGVRVIRLSLTENELSVYQREQRTMAKADELLQLVLA